jgi:multiple sugar transport system substrate-binding protein
LYYSYAPIYYGRKDLMNHPAEREAFKKKYGYDLAPAKTWDQVRDIAEFFTRKKGETLAGEVLADNFYGIVMMGKRHESTNLIWMDWIYTFGGSILDKNNVPTINSQENIEATEFWKSLWKFSPPGTAEYDYMDVLMSFQQGIVAQSICWSDFAFPLEIPGKSKLAGKMAYGPLPVHPKHQIRVAIVEAMVPIISAYSKNKEAAFLFLQWNAEKEFETKLAGMGFMAPVRKAVWKDPSLTSGPFAGIYSAMKDSMDNCLIVFAASPDFLGWPMLNDNFSIMLSEIGMGKKTVKEALDAAQKQALKVILEKK